MSVKESYKEPLRGKILGYVVAEAATEGLEGAVGTMLAASARTGR